MKTVECKNKYTNRLFSSRLSKPVEFDEDNRAKVSNKDAKTLKEIYPNNLVILEEEEEENGKEVKTLSEEEIERGE